MFNTINQSFNQRIDQSVNCGVSNMLLGQINNTVVQAIKGAFIVAFSCQCQLAELQPLEHADGPAESRKSNSRQQDIE